MRLSGLIFLSISFLITIGCHSDRGVKKGKDGIIVYLNDSDGVAQKIRLKVINPSIIRVSATPTNSFSRPKSLMIVPQKEIDGKWTVQEYKDSVVLSTSELQAIVSINTGQVVFKDKNGNILLKEKVHGRIFEPFTVDGNSAFHIQQVFNNVQNSSLYGLGGNQLGYTNLQGKDLTLIQRNSEAFVPFLVSSGHFGILWDNNSITHFGNPNPYLPLDSLTLYNENEEEGGLTATYLTDRKNTSPGASVVREENNIDYEFLEDQSQFPDDFNLSAASSIVWNGFISSEFSGIQSFRLYWGGYIKIWIAGKLVFPKPPFSSALQGTDKGVWRQPWNPAKEILQIPMEKGEKYPIKVKWIPDGGQSYLSLKWKKPKTKEQKNQISFASEMGDMIDYYFVSGKNVDSLIGEYRKLTGKAPIMPKWAYGFWQSRERYSSQKQILDVVKEFRKRKIPLDNIVQDWFYWEEDKWGSQEFDSLRYPDPKGMIEQLHDKYHTHFMISVWPKFYTKTEAFDNFWGKGWLYKKSVKDSIRDWVGDGYVSTFYDAFNADARKAFWGLVDHKLFSLGVDAWWLDATEPDIVSNTSLEKRKNLRKPNALGSSTRYFNAYSLEQSKAFYKGQRSEKPNQRVFILTRSAFAGSQRYAAANWSGDIGATWWDMKNQIATGISYSMSGNPYWTMDIGGFSTEGRYHHPNKENLTEWREQMTRWFQFGAFCPLFRSHGQFPTREPFNVAPAGSPTYESMLYYDKLRYRLMPYIYSLAGDIYLNNTTIMRGLAMNFPADSMAKNVTDEYLFGSNLLINPVYKYKARKRQVYLPQNTGWYNLYSGEYVDGGQTITADAPYNRIPVFVKAGSIIPFGPALQYTQQKKADTITLYVYTGKDGKFDLYEDDGLSYDYEDGAYSVIPLRYNETNHTLTIGNREGSYDGMLRERVFRIKWISPANPQSLNFKATADEIIEYKGKAITEVFK